MFIMLMILMAPMILMLKTTMNSTTINTSLQMLNFNSLPLTVDIIMNWQTMLFTLTVTFISFMIMIYSKDYISSNMNQFMIILSLFVASMITLILSNNMMFVIMGWDGLGLTSYILVMYYQNNTSSAAASITLLTNRVGDILIMMSMALLIHSNTWNMMQNNKMNSMSMIFLMLASFTKSAQFPFTAWLPAAMAAPTPVSALVHSSTLVTAGVWLMFRLSNNIHPTTLKIMMISATLTSLTSSMSAMAEMDLKKIIALSTLSQVAFMMMTISLKMFNLSMFHLITHAMFKATMFMCVGCMINNSLYQDQRTIKSNPPYMKTINTTMGMASMALSGFPFTTGFYSKDAILEQQNMLNSNKMLTMMILISITITTAYNLKITMKALSWNKMKSSDSMNNKMHNMKNSTTVMAPTTMLMGNWLSWVSTTEMSPVIKTNQKLTPLITIIVGSLALMMSKMNKKLSLIMTSMWNMNFISFSPTKITSLGSKSLKTDNSWKESHFLYFNKNTKSSPTHLMISTSMMIMLLPIIL
uniref:NADH-ubiquinone oxidoreductase chain 5 n=2 Tax=unclassified Mesabolivar TaxID=2625251 RepID=A0A411FES9_9ARAC|nr:NADH dehydrogenase subunit 5 [Mesabolivar sp. ITV1036I1]YP_009554254.1 NADH dehydrogenase subunit 5 [Mesabolivar sp. ITV1036I3]QBA91984.1 NADH dehydrogenase subunit 5 [Mesabolivar sp. ITV1036I1]QBA92010.1 NADH dehydrogenase subunit 5 [Mesabolivar sp. ITV1036I3]